MTAQDSYPKANLRREFVSIEDMTEKQLETAQTLIETQISNKWVDWIPHSTYTASPEKTLEHELWGINQDIDGSVLSVSVFRKIQRTESKSGTILNNLQTSPTTPIKEASV